MQELLIKILIPTALMLVLTFVIVKVNPRRINRYKQAIFPYYALFYSVCAAVYFYRYYKNPPEIASIVVEYVKSNETLNALMGVWEILGLNLLLYVTYLVARIIPHVVINLILRKKVILRSYVEIFFEYNEDFSVWVLRDKWSGVRVIFKRLTVVSAALSGIALGVIWYFGDRTDTQVYIFPVVLAMIIAEIFVFLNGETVDEYVKSVGGENSYAQKVSNFYKIRDIYEKVFPHELLSSYTGCDYSDTQAVTDLLDELSKSDVSIERKLAEFFDLNGAEEIYDSDCVHATLKMLKGENVIFFNPFYRDLGRYIILPFLNTLLSGNKVLIIVGRNSVKQDMIEWVSGLLDEYGKIESLWRVKELNEKDPDCEVGVMGFSDFYNEKILEVNRDFLKDTDFVFVHEASLIINTGQVGMSILATEMTHFGEHPTYCFADRLTEGLVDTLSHLIQSEITEIVAAPIPRNIYTAMGWNADGDFLRQKLFDKQTRYLGNGLELAAVAVKNQIPQVSWFGEKKVPVRDVKWIASQFYPTLCRYMNQPVQQQSLYDKIKFISNIWSVPEERESFVIAEDEFTNLFATMRTFLSRGKAQTFVNVLSENYLLRDYMRCNTHMFMSNPNTIPSIVPDYAKTERNTLFKLLILMTYREVYETEILNEFRLVGIDTDDVQELMTRLLYKYTDIKGPVFRIRIEKNEVGEGKISQESVFTITPETFDEKLGESLRNAVYVCEDEKDDDEYIDAKLFGHITQTILPGQFVTYNGKYYIVNSISPRSGVVLRRASNLYDGRKYYRQVRDYEIAAYTDENIISNVTVMDVEVVKLMTDFTVNTTGFLEMKSNNDLRTARLYDISKDPNVGKYVRKYRNKNMLRVKLPDTTVNIRFSICMLMSELFKSVFPDAWQYLAVVTEMPEDVDGMLNYLTYSVSGPVDRDYIYIIEDSELDLGLLEAVEKNLIRFLEIITDYLCWHTEKMREPAAKDPEVVTPEFPAPDKFGQKKKVSLLKRIRDLFGHKKEEDVNIGSADEEEKKSHKPQKIKKTEKDKDKDKEKKQPGEVKPGEKSENGQNEKSGVNPEDENKAGGRSDKPSEKPSEKPEDNKKKPEEPSEKPEDTTGKDNTPVSDNSTEATEIPTDSSEQVVTTTDAAGSELWNGHTDDAKPVNVAPGKAKTSSGSETPELASEENTDIFDEDDTEEDPEHAEYLDNMFEEAGIIPITKTRYQEECFLKFGFDNIDSRIQLEEVRKYLTLRGFANNDYTKARKRDASPDTLLDLKAVACCDFCQFPLSGVSYEKLNDGRIRCNDCSASAINSVEKFKEIFNQVEDMMQNFFNIEYKLSIEVKTVDAEKIARGAGMVFKPSTDFDPRVLGYAQRAHGKYSLFIENGSPRLATILTMSHELTHIWQYLNWNEKEIRRYYPEAYQRDMVYEGMAMWVSIQYLYLIGETSYAAKQEWKTSQRDDIYGAGFNMFREKYPLIKDASLVAYTPFTQFPPL